MEMAEVEKELKLIREELTTIRGYLEANMDESDLQAIKRYHAEKTKGALTSHERLRKELG